MVRAGEVVRGRMELQSHNRQSYDILLSLTAPPIAPGEPEQQVRLFHPGLDRPHEGHEGCPQGYGHVMRAALNVPKALGICQNLEGWLQPALGQLRAGH